MPHDLTYHSVIEFLDCADHRMTDAVDQPEGGEVLGEKLESPALLPLWWCTTRKGIQGGFDLARDLARHLRRQRLLSATRVDEGVEGCPSIVR